MRARRRTLTIARKVGFFERAGWGVGLLAGASLVLFAWWARDVLLIGFAGVLLGILLNTPAGWLSRRTGAPLAVAVAGVAALLVAMLVGTFWLRGAAIADQADALRTQIPQAVGHVEEQLQGTSWGRWGIDQLPGADGLAQGAPAALSTATRMIGDGLTALTHLVLILFIGVVTALSPGVYVDGVVRLAPQPRRARARDILAQVTRTLRWWLLGRLISMLAIGVLTGVGLGLLGVPLAGILGLLAAVLSFVPNFGPLISAVPAVLLGLVDGVPQALAVVGLFAGVQAVESYVLGPLIDKQTVALPPALTVLAQVVAGLAAGLLGVALASPLLAAAIVLLRTLYLEDRLGDAPPPPPRG